jgi:hypothetical protein
MPPSTLPASAAKKTPYAESAPPPATAPAVISADSPGIGMPIDSMNMNRAIAM